MSTPDDDAGGITSILDTDLYKLTMQCAVLKHFPDTNVTYAFTNRTPHMLFSQAAFDWLQQRIEALAEVKLSESEYNYLKNECSYLDHGKYLQFLRSFRFRPKEHVHLRFEPRDHDLGALDISVEGLWADTILYEIPLLALISESYFKFRDRDWNYDGQRENAHRKGLELLQRGCLFSEFGTRRRRDSRTQDLVLQGLIDASKELGSSAGKLTGTSNVHFAMRYGLMPIGTVAHEWFMGIAAATNSYRTATEAALQCWLDCFGPGILGIALTDTFGTNAFLKAFSKPAGKGDSKTYAQLFKGVRQDSGDPKTFIDMMREYYDGQGIGSAAIVFSDSLNIDLCLEYKQIAEEQNFQPSFGIGTFLTNDFRQLRDDKKSVPLNIVIKLSSADGRPAVKLSDDLGKNTGDSTTVEKVKAEFGYVDKHWEGAEEKSRWG